MRPDAPHSHCHRASRTAGGLTHLSAPHPSPSSHNPDSQIKIASLHTYCLDLHTLTQKNISLDKPPTSPTIA